MVKQIANKIIAILLIIAMTMANMLLIAKESYAAIEELEEQKTVSSNKNVSFDTFFYVGRNTHSIGLDTSKESIINFEVNVGDGYLKNSIIELKDANFEITGIESQSENDIVSSFEANKIELKQISSKTKIDVAAKIKLNHPEVINEEYLAKENEVLFTSSYTNIKGKTEQINSSIKVYVDWNSEAEVNVDTNIDKYMFLNEKTIIQTKVTSGIKDNVLPIKNTNIKISTPYIENTYPEEVRVRATKTIGTNGDIDGLNFNTENYNYNKETGVVEINVDNNENNDKNFSWKNGEDEYIVTYIYNGYKNLENITINASSNITTYKNTNIENRIEKEQDLSLIENNVEFELQATESLKKGYLYANKETEYKSIWSANVAYIDATDMIVFQQNTDKFVKDNEKTQYVDLYYKQTKINAEIFNKIIGQDGKIEIYNAQNNSLLGEINKDTAKDEQGNYVFNYNGEIANIMVKTTKPVAEGKISIENIKAIKGNTPYSFDEKKEFRVLENSLVGSSTNQKIQELKVNTTLEETATKSYIQVSKDSLSTIVKNEDVELRAVLQAEDITEDLYKNPTIEIRLPEEVQKIDVKSGNLLFTDELKISTIEIENNNIIRMRLEGEQTDFVTDGNKGITIILNVDLTLNRIAPSRDAETTMVVSNEKAVALENDGVSSATTNVVAPVGIIALNSVTNTKTGETATSLKKNKEEVKLERKTESQVATYTNTIINNTEGTVSNVKVIGNIPAKNDEMGSTLDAKLLTEVKSAQELNYEVYYTENKDATNDLDKMENGWQTKAIQNAKKYLILINENIEQGRELNFVYNIELPENLDYGQKAISTYKVEYTEGAKQNGQIASLNSVPVIRYSVAEQDTNAEEHQVTATPVTATTGNGAILQATLNSNIIGEDVYKDSILKFEINVENRGTSTAENTKATIEVPDWLWYMEKNSNVFDMENQYIVYEDMRNVEIEIGNVPSNSSISKEILLEVKDINKQSNIQATISGNNIENIETNAITIKSKEKILDFYFIEEDCTKQEFENENCIYTLTIDNIDSNENIDSVDIFLPQDASLESLSVFNNTSDMKMDEIANYNQNQKKITINLNDIGKNILIVTFVINPGTTENNKTIQLYAEAKANQKTQKTNGIKTYITKKTAEVNAVSSVAKGSYVKVGDNIDYTISIKNNSNIEIKDSSINIKLANELDCKKILFNGVDVTNNLNNNYNDEENEDDDDDEDDEDYEETDEEDLDNMYSYIPENNEIIIYRDIKVNETFNIVIQTKIDDEIERKEDTNILSTVSSDTFSFNEAFNYILQKNDTDEDNPNNPNNPSNPNNPDNPNNPNNPDNPTEEKYKISGTAWLDINKDGKMDNDETKLSGINVIAIDSKGNSKATAKTGENGEYTLENLEEGTYTVIFEYDTSKYTLTQYQKEGIEETYNSNVISGKYNGKDVATTNNIKITDRSIANINIGLLQGSNFDLSLSKKVTQISMANTKTTKVNKYNTNLAKIDLDYKYINNTNIAVEYEITITNEGDIPGTATKIVDYLPKEFDFSSELNKDWYKSGNNIETKALANTEINPGESKTVTLVLTKSMTENDNGIVCNSAEIAETYNDYGKDDTDSTPGNNKDGEDDISSANVILGLRTGGPITYITLTLALMALITFGAYEINKRVLKI